MGARYLANMNTKEIHDLKADIKLKTRGQCQLDEIKEKHKKLVYTEVTVESLVRNEGYNGCKWCLSKYHTD
ncbi:3-hydroxyacyl-CoA dehydrogenase [Halobacteriota archaeon]